MAENRDPRNDGLGPDPLDRGSGKVMGGGSGGGGGSDFDPSYEDALRIMGRGHKMPSPFVQRPFFMDDPEAAELAVRLTALRRAGGAGPGPFKAIPALGPTSGASETGRAVEEFVAALQEVPPDPKKLAALRGRIGQGEPDVRAGLEKVCEHPAVQAKLAE